MTWFRFQRPETGDVFISIESPDGLLAITEDHHRYFRNVKLSQGEIDKVIALELVLEYTRKKHYGR